MRIQAIPAEEALPRVVEEAPVPEGLDGGQGHVGDHGEHPRRDAERGDQSGPGQHQRPQRGEQGKCGTEAARPETVSCQGGSTLMRTPRDFKPPGAACRPALICPRDFLYQILDIPSFFKIKVE